MARVDDLLAQALKNLPSKPPDQGTKPSEKKRYSEQVSQAIALVFAEELRLRGLDETKPAPPGVAGTSGAERRMSGGIGAKKVDVTAATEESGLLLGISIKTINFRDLTTGNFQKNLTNRRGDMLFEGVTLHRRFPYAVLAGFFFLDKEAATDDTDRRDSTFLNAHAKFRLFTNRGDPGGRAEQYECLYVCLLDANQFSPQCDAYPVGSPQEPQPWGEIFDDLIVLVAERNSDFYDAEGGCLVRTS